MRTLAVCVSVVGLILSIHAQQRSVTPLPQIQSQQIVDSIWIRVRGGDKASLSQLTALAEFGNAEAQTTLGLAYAVGKSVPKNVAQAVSWFRKAGDHGSAPAQYNLGMMYEKGKGVPKDAVQAASWYLKAAEQGYFLAQGNLGAMYESGRGVPKNLVIAYMWRNLAASQDQSAKKKRDALEHRMTTAQIAEGQMLSREWTPKPVQHPQQSTGSLVILGQNGDSAALNQLTTLARAGNVEVQAALQSMNATSRGGGNGPIRVDGKVPPGKLIFHPNPAYPSEARTARISGSVTLSATIDKTGTIKLLKVMTATNPQLIPGVVETVQTWKYEPALVNNEPVEVITTIVITFSLGR